MHRSVPDKTARPLLLGSSLRTLEVAHGNDGLMARAGAAAADWAMALRRDISAPVLVLAGPGNNGGDALVTADRLRQAGVATQVVFIATPDKLPAAAAQALSDYRNNGGELLTSLPSGPFSLLIDGLFGIGLARPLDGAYANLVVSTQALARNIPLLALDCPSGLNTDTGEALGIALRATHTLSFIAGKPGLYSGDGPDLSGIVRCTDLGIPAQALSALANGWLTGNDDLLQVARPRRRNSHKGDFGSLGILGGAPGMAGAALLAGRAALKLGCGRVYVGMPGDKCPALDYVQPELMLRGADAMSSTPLTALVCGPGLGLNTQAKAILAEAIKGSTPLLLDADALTLLSLHRELVPMLKGRGAVSLLTPHPGEAARLLACDTQTIARDRIGAAVRIADKLNAWVALKGSGTVIAAPTGDWWINPSGNPLLATAGTGDVLAGLAGSLLAQGHDAGLALRAAVLLHGLAADAAQARGIDIGLTASELIDEARQLFSAYMHTAQAR